MTKIFREYVIPLPFSSQKYRIAQLYTVALVSQQEATGDTAIKIVQNDDINHEIYGNCRLTNKIFYLNSKVPSVIRAVVPKKALIVEENAYNAFPICHTFYKNQAFSEDTFYGSVISDHKDITDWNVLELPQDYIKNNKNKTRKNHFKGIKDDEFLKSNIKIIDICDNVQNEKYNPNEMVINGIKMEKGWFHSQKSDFMVCEKFVTLKFECFGLGWLVYELEKQIDKVFIAAHQQMVCLYEQWKDKTMDDIRLMEEDATKKLNMKEGKEMK
ncbi:Phosphatidylinositol transfer protein [Pseudoloma neurophilia]|uniref:Phosphatidylinositol transfer protein n=1 Tax=Pseudoloma neurophilia TaxID=146866 RepID=A0A0R0LWE5_9MICR|nr:Phosphatidylinositol transfer protein [Pseudoloma neurophilia]